MAPISILLALSAIAQQPAPADVKSGLLEVRQSLARNQIALQQYTWIETMETLVKGKVRSTQTSSCRYGPDGKVEKTPVSTPAPAKDAHGIRKKVADHKKDDLTDYIERAVTLVRQYVPPSAERLQSIVQEGTAAAAQPGGGKIVLRFGNYFRENDSLTVTFDVPSKTIDTLGVSSYLGDPKKDTATLAVAFRQLPDGTNHPASIVLKAPAKKVEIRVTNANYQKLAR
jgi:hypothetical protein